MLKIQCPYTVLVAQLGLIRGNLSLQLHVTVVKVVSKRGQ